MGRPSPRFWPALLAAVGLAFAAVSWRTRTDAPTAALSQEACLNRTDFDDDDFRRTDHATRSPDDDALDEEGRSAHVYVKDPSTGYVWRCYRDLWDNERPVTDAHGQHQTSLMNERAIAVLERHAAERKSEPIFAYVSYPNAHLPLQPPTELLERRNATLLTKKTLIFAI